MKKLILAGVLALGSIASPAAMAGEPVALDASSTTNSTNQQQNSGSVVLNPSGGTQVNNNVNNAYSSTYSFGPGISCPTPSFALNAYGGSSNAWSDGFSGTGSGSYGASASFIVPIGGETGAACRTLVREIANQRVLDTKVNMIRVCSELTRQGVQLDLKDFPEFEACRSVTVAGRQAVAIDTAPVFTEPSTAIPVVPVRKN